MGLDMFLSAQQSVTFEMIYWRKADHIHAWFVKNVQGGVDDGAEYIVTIENLIDLDKICKRVLKQATLAPIELPCTRGYGIDYFDSLEYTIKMLKPILNINKPYRTFYYRSSW
jgi:hypothetical protein